MKKLLISLTFFLSSQLLYGQFDNTALENRIRPDSAATGEIHFNFYNFNFVRNYEYTNAFHDGYTLYGTQIQPQVVYYAHPNLAVTMGVLMRKDFGNSGIHDYQPLFNLKYHKRHLTLAFGNLEGNIMHRYIEPIYDFERIIIDPVEYGTQLIIERDRFKLDAWIAWQHMIYRGDAEKEEILGGLSLEGTVAEFNGWKFSLPAQFLAHHRGGQIDELKDVPVTTIFNGATGFKIHKTLKGHVKEIYTDNYIVGYTDLSKSRTQAFNGGFGVWLNAGVDSKFGSLLATYWNGNNFVTIKGMPLYSSVSHNLYNDGFRQNHRNIISLRYAYQKELVPNLYLDVRFEPHIDLDHPDKQLQFNHSFFLIYKKDFKIYKIKQ